MFNSLLWISQSWNNWLCSSYLFICSFRYLCLGKEEALNVELRIFFVLAMVLQKIFCVDLDMTFPLLCSFKLVALLKQVMFIIFFSLHSFPSQGILPSRWFRNTFSFFINKKWLDKEVIPRVRKKKNLPVGNYLLPGACVLGRWASWATGQFHLLSTGHMETPLNLSPQCVHSVKCWILHKSVSLGFHAPSVVLDRFG